MSNQTTKVTFNEVVKTVVFYVEEGNRLRPVPKKTQNRKTKRNLKFLKPVPFTSQDRRDRSVKRD